MHDVNRLVATCAFLAAYRTVYTKQSQINMFYLTRSVYPDVQIRKLTVANQQLYALVGLRRKLPPGQYFMQTPVHQGSRLPQGGTPPQLRQSRTASPPVSMDTNHVPRTPTPPMRTEGLVTSMPARSQSPSLPGQRPDVMFPNARSSPQPGNFQLQTRPPASSGPAPPPSVMSASEFLGSLVGGRPSNTRNSSTTDIPSAPSNLVPSSCQTMTSSNTQKSVSARLPDLVSGSAGPSVTSSPKADGPPTARMPDVVSDVASTANGDLLGKCDVGQLKKADQATLAKSSQTLNNIAPVAGSSRELPATAKKVVIVNGTIEDAGVLNSETAVVNSSHAKLPAVNG